MSEAGDRRRRQLVVGLLQRLHLEQFSRRYDPTLVLAVFTLVNGSISIGLIAAVALTTGASFIFPSLGPTAFILFHAPMSTAAAPRGVLLGHLVGAVTGWISLAIFGLLDAPDAFHGGMDWPRVAAAALSLGGTGFVMVLLRAVHPPAGATALIVSLGLMPSLTQIPVLMAAVLLLIVKAFLLNRMAGIPYPLWHERPLVPAYMGEPSR